MRRSPIVVFALLKPLNNGNSHNLELLRLDAHRDIACSPVRLKHALVAILTMNPNEQRIAASFLEADSNPVPNPLRYQPNSKV